MPRQTKLLLHDTVHVAQVLWVTMMGIHFTSCHANSEAVCACVDQLEPVREAWLHQDPCQLAGRHQVWMVTLPNAGYLPMYNSINAD